MKQSVKPPHNVKLFKQLHVGSSNPVGMVSIGGPCCTTKVCGDEVLQTIVSCKYKTMPLYVVLKNLNLARHSVYGDGSYLYPSIAHQAGFIVKTSCSDKEPFKTS